MIRAEDREDEPLGPFVYGTDGTGARNLIVPCGGMRERYSSAEEVEDNEGNWRSSRHLYMNGAELFGFTMAEVPGAVKELCAAPALFLPTTTFSSSTRRTNTC